MVDHLFISKGTQVFVPIQFVNKSETLWGPDAATFDPGGWLASEKDKRHGRWEEISGYKHLLSFADGPRVCPGKNYALAEIKV
jgi:cytochrome P450